MQHPHVAKVARRSQSRQTLDRTRGKRPCAAILLSSVLLLAACNQAPDPPPPLINELRSEQTFQLKIQTPTPAWSLKIAAIYATGTDLVCVSQLSRSEGMVTQVISDAEASFTVTELGGPHAIRHYILGKTWNWNGNPEVTFIDSLDEIKDALADARSVPFTTP